MMNLYYHLLSSISIYYHLLASIIHDYPLLSSIEDGLLLGSHYNSWQLSATGCHGNPSWRSRKADARQVHFQDHGTCYAMLSGPLVSCLEAGIGWKIPRMPVARYFMSARTFLFRCWQTIYRFNIFNVNTCAEYIIRSYTITHMQIKPYKQSKTHVNKIKQAK